MSEEPKLDASSVEGYIAPELYDIAYGWWTEDIPFYVAQARAAKGPVLEVGCGTGRIYLPVLQAGADADGFDLHPGMLEVLKSKAAALGLKPRVFQADMRDFTLPRRYALITIPFRAFLHNLTTQDQLRTLRCCRQHLESDGQLVLDLFHPSFARLVEPDGQWRLEKEFAHPQTGAPLTTWSTRTTDRVNQVMHVQMEIRGPGPGGAAVVHRHVFDLRWIYKAELELLLQVAGFPRWEICGGFNGEPLERDDQQMIAWAWRD
jgi:SAM-dependent methyltransferase